MTAANIFLSELYRLADRKGLDAQGLLSRAGISPEAINAPGVRVDTEKLAVIVQGIWDGVEDEAMGLSASTIPRGSFHMMGTVAIGERNLRQALLMGIRFYAMVTDAFSMELKEEGDQAILKFHMVSPELDKSHLFAEINLMGWHRFASWLISENVVLNVVYFDYAPPKYVSEYAYLFPGEHHFGADFQGFSFHRKFLDHEILRNKAALKRFIKRCPNDFFIQPKTDFSLTSELKRMLKKKLPDSFPVIDEVADTLHMTRRTLIRKLSDEGTSYQKLKNLVRCDHAVYLLTKRTMPLAAVAEAVGFSDPAVFTRAFKAWTGVSPRDYRRTAGAPNTEEMQE
ncbi:AraC family transcriptional regulator [Kordiimonas lipolytica]|uniref:AraC family transcriptional regulator n=1 Tax=Kordiimonas lipolytica TaxID=1662421 RepID=A0ABV8U8Y3_9PROT|nr:AraC family transcriptional regulator [Kordiimonas lipolytica]